MFFIEAHFLWIVGWLSSSVFSTFSFYLRDSALILIHYFNTCFNHAFIYFASVIRAHMPAHICDLILFKPGSPPAAQPRSITGAGTDLSVYKVSYDFCIWIYALSGLPDTVQPNEKSSIGFYFSLFHPQKMLP